MKLICQWCGKEYDGPTWRASKFCGLDCYHAYRRGLRLNSMEMICQWCGKKFVLCRSWAKRGRKHCSMACYAETMKMQLPHPMPTRKGYIRLRVHGHPLANRAGDVLEHRLIFWQESGYDEQVLELLQAGATIHHKNGAKDDNRVENLELWISSKHPCGVRYKDVVAII